MSSQNAGGQCPRCLMAMNLDSQTMPQGEEATAMAPLSPEELAENFPQFEILECLGRGGMGVVYKARQKALERTVALKLLAGEWQGDGGFAERFEKEAKTLAQMSHPNIVTIHDFGEAGGHYFIVMEFVDGVNLRDLLRDGKMEPEQALAIVPPICEALEYAHEKGVVHRDIKPENLLLDREGRLKIADFGIASSGGDSGTEKAGTPAYMAPEQSGTHVDKRADIYALGVVLYEMLTGERPAKDFVSPSQKVEVDVRIDEMVLRALESEPEKRYQTAGEFRTVVETMSHPREKTESVGSPPTTKLRAFWIPSLIAYIVTNSLWALTGLAALMGRASAEGTVWFFIAWVVSTVLWAMLHYHCWKALPAKHRATSPGKAVGFLFIPFYNLYWAFVSFPMLADGVNACRAESGHGPNRWLKRLGVLYAINFLLYWTAAWNPLIGLFVCVFDLVIFILFYRLVVRKLEGEPESQQTPVESSKKGWVPFIGALAFFFGILSGLIPTLFYWLRPWAAPWLTDQALSRLLEFTAVAAVAAVLLGFFSRRLWWGLQGLIMGSVSLVIWLSFFFAGQLSKPTGDREMAMVGTSRDNYGRVYEARGGSEAMVDSDGDATIFHIDSEVLRFEGDRLQLNGYEVAKVPRNVDILIEKKGEVLKVFSNDKLLLSQSKRGPSETKLLVSDQFSLGRQSSFVAEIEALVVKLQNSSDLPKLIDIDDQAVRLFRVPQGSFSSENEFISFFRGKEADFFVEKLSRQWAISFPKQAPLELGRIPAAKWQEIEPSQVSSYLSSWNSISEGYENEPYNGVLLPSLPGEPVYLAFRTLAGTEGVMAVTESSQVEGLKFQIRYSPPEESDSANQPLRFVPVF